MTATNENVIVGKSNKRHTVINVLVFTNGEPRIFNGSLMDV